MPLLCKIYYTWWPLPLVARGMCSSCVRLWNIPGLRHRHDPGVLKLLTTGRKMMCVLIQSQGQAGQCTINSPISCLHLSRSTVFSKWQVHRVNNSMLEIIKDRVFLAERREQRGEWKQFPLKWSWETKGTRNYFEPEAGDMGFKI